MEEKWNYAVDYVCALHILRLYYTICVLCITPLLQINWLTHRFKNTIGMARISRRCLERLKFQNKRIRPTAVSLPRPFNITVHMIWPYNLLELTCHISGTRSLSTCTSINFASMVNNKRPAFNFSKPICLNVYYSAQLKFCCLIWIFCLAGLLLWLTTGVVSCGFSI